MRPRARAASEPPKRSGAAGGVGGGGVSGSPTPTEERMKVGVVVVTHGQLAAELLNAAEMIVGDLPHFAAVSIGWHDDVDQAREEIGRTIERVREKAGTPGVLVLTDMFGGTPANLGVTFLETDKVEVITGL